VVNLQKGGVYRDNDASSKHNVFVYMFRILYSYLFYTCEFLYILCSIAVLLLCVPAASDVHPMLVSASFYPSLR
jgi:hypothetical protein